MPGSEARSLGTAWDSWSGSAAHLCAHPLPQAGNFSLRSRALRPSRALIDTKGHWRRGVAGRRNGREVGRVSVTLRGLFISFPSPPPSLFLQTVSVNKAINTQEVAVKEKHARNILFGLDPWEADQMGGQMVGTEVRRKLLTQRQE